MRDRATLESSFAIPASIALTAYAEEHDQQQALKAGFSQHLPRPIDPETLINAVFSLNRQIQQHS